MTGDGTNDAPALAQADVGVAMNTGTQAAKEAGNMVDLDSNPTKLIEVVEIGKQLLITRGSLTTFSIANDVAKYFAIIPAMFAGVLPVLDRINVMGLDTPRSAIASAVIFNALVIVALIPLALRGVRFRAESAAAVLRRNLLIYGVGDPRAGDEDRGLERVVGLLAQPPGDRRQQALLRLRRLGARVEQHEAAGPVGVLRLARRVAGLAEQRRLLVAGDPRDRDLAAELGGRPVDLGRGRPARAGAAGSTPSSSQSSASQASLRMSNSSVREAFV